MQEFIELFTPIKEGLPKDGKPMFLLCYEEKGTSRIFSGYVHSDNTITALTASGESFEEVEGVTHYLDLSILTNKEAEEKWFSLSEKRRIIANMLNYDNSKLRIEIGTLKSELDEANDTIKKLMNSKDFQREYAKQRSQEKSKDLRNEIESLRKQRDKLLVELGKYKSNS